MVKYINWINKNVRGDYSQKRIFISGGNSGIGFEATRNFVSLGANIIWGCRNLKKAEEAKTKILQEFACANIEIFQLDLADVNSIENCANLLIQKYDCIDVIYNNAGVFRIPQGKTKQNFELVVGTNLIGTYVLNKILLEKYEKSHFIFTTSITAFFNKFDTKDPFFENRKYGNFKAYGSSKFGINQMVTFWKEKYKETNRKFSLIHPGITYTPLIKKAYKSKVFSYFAAVFMKILFHTSEKASLVALKAVEQKNSFDYFGPRGIFGISGFPKKRKLLKKYYRDNENTFEFLEGLTIFK